MSVGWLMVAVTFFTQFLCMGFLFYSFGVVLKPLASEFGGGRLGVTMLPLAMSLGGALMAPIIGRWVAAGSIRNIMAIGCVCTGLGFLAGAHASALWQLMVLYGTLLSFGAGTMGGLTAQALVVNWFEDNRTMALGASLMGVSLSGMVMAHATTWLIADGGWRWTFEVFGWSCLAATPIVWWLVVSRPPRQDDGDADSRPAQPTAAFDTLAALREPNLWIIAVSTGLIFMGTTGIMTHAIAFATDVGFSSAQAAWILSTLAGGAAAGKIVFGWLAQRLGERTALYVAIALQAIAIVGLVATQSYPLLIAVCGGLGLGIGGVMPLAAALLARCFGPAAFGPMMGLMTPMLIPFQSAGAPFAGWVFDSTGSYDTAWWTFLGAIVVSGALVGALRIEPSEPAATGLALSEQAT